MDDIALTNASATGGTVTIYAAFGASVVSTAGVFSFLLSLVVLGLRAIREEEEGKRSSCYR